ncbi:hypothetical protein ACKC9G_06375 [Pokkaliibacter sp. CJK22405]|uniref:hypothetical protein n=1 Tax=Pokkaliibacter sp. CJK22405 TaxID=3384615 RepID=UPI00398463D5
MQTEMVVTSYRVSLLSLIRPVILFVVLLLLANALFAPLEHWLTLGLTELTQIDFIQDLVSVSWAGYIPYLLYIPALWALKKLVFQLLYTFNMSIDVTADALIINARWPVSYKAHIKFNRVESVRLEAIGYPINKCAHLTVVGLGGTQLSVRHLSAARDLVSQIGQPC